MVFHVGGKYKTEADLKAKRDHHDGAVAFREPSQAVFAAMANIGCLFLLAVMIGILLLIGKPDIRELGIQIGIAAGISVLLLVPHEFLHAVCFREDVYLYYDISKMLVFVHGTESMSKQRFIFMSLLPNIIFGVIPYALFFLNHNWLFAGLVGAFCTSMGFGDYINVFNAMTQMPKGAKTYLCGFHSYWYTD